MSLLMLLGATPATPSTPQGFRSMHRFWMGGAAMTPTTGTTWPGYIAPFGYF